MTGSCRWWIWRTPPLTGSWAASSVTEGLVDLISLEQRTLIARALALAWELSVDLVLALPALGYRESRRPPWKQEPWRKYLQQDTRPTWRQLFLRALRKPTTLRWTRPLATAAVVLAGACAVARLVQGTVYLSWRELLGEQRGGRGGARPGGGGAGGDPRDARVARGAAQPPARGHRLARRTSATGCRRSRMGSWARRWRCPWRIAAALDASPLLSFLR